MDVHLRDLRYFVAVAEEASFTRAASERLFISQPALSKQIKALERSLRTQLFQRDHRRVTLTEAGEVLLPHARELLAHWEAAGGEVAEAAARTNTSLRVGFQTRIGRGLVPAVLDEMDRRMPGWTLGFRQVSWADPTVGLDKREVDVALVWLPLPADVGFEHVVVASEPRSVALPAGHRLARRRSVPFVELLDEPFIALPSTAGVQRDFWLAAEQRPRPARIAQEAASAEETFEAIAAGLGVALVSSGNAELYHRDDIACRPVSGIPHSELAVVWRADDTREAVRTVVRTFCRCHAG